MALLLLLGTCMLLLGMPVHTKPSPDELVTVYACEGSTMNLECSGGRTIRIARSNYGRLNMDTCYDGSSTESWYSNCLSLRSVNIVNELCHNKETCYIPATNRMFGDPCHNTPKYLEVHYYCEAEMPSPSPYSVLMTEPMTVTAPSPHSSRPTSAIIDYLGKSTSSYNLDKFSHPQGFDKKNDSNPRNINHSQNVLNIGLSSSTVPSTELVGGEEVGQDGVDTDSVEHIDRKPTLAPDPPTDVTSPASTREYTIDPTKLPPNVKHCESVVARDITWPNTMAGRSTMQLCPNVPNRFARWYCGMNPVKWLGFPDLSECVSNEVEMFADSVSPSSSVVQVVEDLTHLTKKPMYGGDVAKLTDVMEEIVNKVEVEVSDLTEQEKEEIVTKVNEGVVVASSDLLSAEKNESWKDLPQQSQAKAATRLVNAVEHSAFQLADVKRAPTIKVEVNIMLQVNIINTNEEVNDVVFPDIKQIKDSGFENDANWVNTKDQIYLPGSTIRKHGVDGIAKLIFLSYQNLEKLLKPQSDESNIAEQTGPETEFISNPDLEEEDTNIINEEKKPEEENQEEEKERIVNTNIISASINNRNEKVHLDEPVIYTLEHKTQNNVFNPTCAFWEYSERDMHGNWSEFGCKLHKTNQTHTECECNHLTNFAVLMDVVGTKLQDHHVFGLMLITYLGCIISIICLLLAWLTFMFIKNLQCDRNTIHKNLVLCLFLAEVIFLCGISQADKPILCSIIAGCLHYLFLAAFAWMCLEGIQLYVMLVEVFEAEKSRVKYYYLAAYGLPAIVVIISAAVYPSGYGTEVHCWLCTKSGFIWAFVGPVMAVITVNIVMLSVAIYQMCKHASNMAACKMNEKSRADNISTDDMSSGSEKTATSPTKVSVSMSWLKGATVLVILLGLTWAFGLLYVNEGTVAFAYIFALLNSLQGCFIFIFHCALNEKVQKEYKRCVRRATWLPDCIRVKYGGAKAYSSTSPHSSSSNNYFQKLWSGRRRRRKSSTTTLRPSSTPSTKLSPGRLSDNSMSNELAQLNPAPPPPHSITAEMTEDPNDYLEPVKIRIEDSLLENGGICGELSQIEGSVVDSDFLIKYCGNQKSASPTVIDVDKYKIGSTDRELEYSDTELQRALQKEREIEETRDEYPSLRSESQQNRLNKLGESDVDDDTLKLKKRPISSSSSSNGSLDDINNLNKGASDSSKSLNISTPNIHHQQNKASTPPNSQACNTLRPGLSNPDIPHEVAVDKVKKALSNSNEGLVELRHGGSRPSQERLSADTQDALRAHGIRLTSSDC